MKTYLITGLLGLTLLGSCNGAKHKEQLEEIDGLRKKLVRVDSVLATVDREEAERLGTEVRNNSQFIQFNVNKIGDTLDFKTALFLTNYRSLLRGFETVDETHKQIGSAVDSISNNLNNLQHDIENNSLAQGLTPEGCIEQEEEQINEVYEKAGELRSILQGAKAGYDTLAPKVRDYMAELSIKLAEKQNTPGGK
jgi:hypothetical protein